MRAAHDCFSFTSDWMKVARILSANRVAWVDVNQLHFDSQMQTALYGKRTELNQCVFDHRIFETFRSRYSVLGTY